MKLKDLTDKELEAISLEKNSRRVATARAKEAQKILHERNHILVNGYVECI